MAEKQDPTGWNMMDEPTCILTKADLGVVVVDMDTHVVLQLLKREIAFLDESMREIVLSEGEVVLFKTFFDAGADEVKDDLPDGGCGFVKEYRKVFGLF